MGNNNSKMSLMNSKASQYQEQFFFVVWRFFENSMTSYHYEYNIVKLLTKLKRLSHTAVVVGGFMRFKSNGIWKFAKEEETERTNDSIEQESAANFLFQANKLRKQTTTTHTHNIKMHSNKLLCYFWICYPSPSPSLWVANQREQKGRKKTINFFHDQFYRNNFAERQQRLLIFAFHDMHSHTHIPTQVNGKWYEFISLDFDDMYRPIALQMCFIVEYILLIVCIHRCPSPSLHRSILIFLLIKPLKSLLPLQLGEFVCVCVRATMKQKKTAKRIMQIVYIG